MMKFFSHAFFYIIFDQQNKQHRFEINPPQFQKNIYILSVTFPLPLEKASPDFSGGWG